MRVLHYWLSHLSKVSTATIEEVETDLQCLPVMFGIGGIGKIKEAVTAAEELLERVDEMECVVQYKTVLQICQVLTKKNMLFVKLHEKYLQPSVVSERRNSITDLRRLMGDIKEVCDRICGGAGDETKSVKVNMSMRVFSVGEWVEEKNKHKKGGESHQTHFDREAVKRKREDTVAQVGEGRRQPAQDRPTHHHAMQSSPGCRYEKCEEEAFRHRKDRGGHIHESGMCFDHFVEAVREGKKDKPAGVPLKGGKKMVLKRGENLKWKFQILSVKLGEDESAIQQMLMADGNRLEGKRDEEERVFLAFMQNDTKEMGGGKRRLVVEYEGGFDLADLEAGRGALLTESREGGTTGGDNYPVLSNAYQ